MALRTIMMASCSERSVSSMNCSAPPRRIIVHVRAFGQPVKKLYLQSVNQKIFTLTHERECIIVSKDCVIEITVRVLQKIPPDWAGITVCPAH